MSIETGRVNGPSSKKGFDATDDLVVTDTQ